MVESSQLVQQKAENPKSSSTSSIQASVIQSSPVRVAGSSISLSSSWLDRQNMEAARWSMLPRGDRRHTEST